MIGNYKQVRLYRFIALFLLVALLTTGTGLAFADGSTAQGTRKASPNLKSSNKPTHINNGTLKTLLGMDSDSDTTDSNLSLSALCQSLIGQTNLYKKPSPNVDMINGDTIVQAGTQLGCNSAQNETTIAVNPENPKNLVAGTNDYRIFNTREGRNDGSGWAYTTFDGGATWKDVQLPHLTFQTGATGALSDMDSAGDPAIAFGPDNTVYYANIVFSRLNAGGGITISVSHNGGLTWGEPEIVQLDGVDSAGNPLPTDFFNDKEWVGVDPETGTAYVSWTRFGLVDSPIVVSKRDQRTGQWSPFVQVNPTFTPGGITSYSQGSYPQVGKHGELYIAYESAVCQSLNCDQPTDHDAIIVAKSTNGGRTFTNTEAAVDYDFPYNPDTGRSTLTGENFRINSFPSFAIDPQTGRLYITWADDRNGQYDSFGNSIKTNGDVFVATSGNGNNWNLYQLGTSADEVYPAIAAYDSKIAVTFYTRSYDRNGTGLDYAYVKANGLGNLKQNDVTRITTQTSDPGIQFVGVGAVSGKILQGIFIGDYTAVAMGSDLVIHPCWTDFRGMPGLTSPNQDAYTQAIPLK
ncbi:MAG: exo-alpha-sialidase [Chloroflexi bacterium]|uniref:Exo-alpha-sialidase n=1 Tax=Candidatus Chlorohelix allophototropha TaxID=3003348 RepID=A0A8T7M1P5_9CHLR|nr:exo-alpha-sialidase [Chloroflexota bacterium]WJW67870.1 glycoside hydrolase [Chloroflexota bacterium L227-S17]